MAQINKPSDYFNTKLYAGNSGTQSISGINFQPDFLWIKRRNIAGDHNLVDIIRTSDKTLISNDTGTEYSNATITSFDSDGFSLSGSDGALNASGSNYVAWNWLASNTTASNTDGSITSTVSANTTSGFSIVSYTGTGSNATVGHGLGKTPDFIIIKTRDTAYNWVVWKNGFSTTERLLLDTTGAISTGEWNTLPTSSVFGLGTQLNINKSGDKFIAYCFAEKKGFSKFGSYTGNGDSDGTFIYTGFKPAYIFVKRTDGSGGWHIMDNKRDPINPLGNLLLAESSSGTNTVSSNRFDLLSNGFKCRDNSGGSNASGGTFIYMSFAENPLVGTNNIPATAR